LTYLGEPVVNSLNAVGIRLRLRPIERAAFYQGWAEKKYRNLIQGGSSRFGNATRSEQLLIGGAYDHGSYAVAAGSWGGRRLSLGDYVAGPGPRDAAIAAGGC
jgi:hypothetical protein